jgi:hypothetical protein
MDIWIILTGLIIAAILTEVQVRRIRKALAMMAMMPTMQKELTAFVEEVQRNEDR